VRNLILQTARSNIQNQESAKASLVDCDDWSPFSGKDMPDGLATNLKKSTRWKPKGKLLYCDTYERSTTSLVIGPVMTCIGINKVGRSHQDDVEYTITTMKYE